MLTIEEALQQAQLLNANDETWIQLVKYPTKVFYDDMAGITNINLESKTIEDFNDNVSTKEENNSQYITFIMDRFYDGVDLVNMLIQIDYLLEDGTGGISSVVNGYYSQEHIKFGWIVPDNVTYKAGTTKVIVFCNGKLPDGSDYLLKTKPFLYTIHDTIDVGSGIPKPDDNWFLQFEEQQEALVQQSEGYRDEAVEAASSASSSATSASDSATLSESYAVGGTGTRPNEDTDNAKYYYEQIVGYPTTGLLGRVEDLEEATEHLSDGDTVYPYASEIEIEDALGVNAKNVSVKITAQQDLHGYDHPWPGGAGKNKLPMTVANIKAANTGGSWSGNVYTVSGVSITILTDGENVIGFRANGTATSTVFFATGNKFEFLANVSYAVNGMVSTNTSAYLAVNNGVNVQSSQDQIQTFNATREEYVYFIITSGYTAVNVDVYPMIRLATETDPTFEPYENNCPISGWNECEIEDVGFNIWDEEWDLGKISTIGTDESGNNIRSKNYIPVKDGVTYYFTYTGNDMSRTAGIRPRFYDADYNYLGYSAITYNREFTTQDMVPGTRYMRFYTQDSYTGVYKKDLCLNYSKTEGYPQNGVYVPYKGKTYTIQLGDTIYGGTIDVTTGVMTVTHGIRVFNGTENWGAGTDVGNCYRMRYTIADSANNVTISNYLQYKDGYSLDEPHQYVYNTQLYVFLPVSDDTTFKAYLASNNLQIVYKLATPITIQLTPQQIQLFEGYNLISANTGDIQVTTTDIKGAIGQADELIEDNKNSIQSVSARVPDAPSVDGTYILTATVSSGEVIYEWIEQL